jgi:hypothetical protein
MRATRLPELRRVRQVRAPRREVDAGQHDLVVAGGDEALHLIDHFARGTEREFPRP